jgi:hypothetical protein
MFVIQPADDNPLFLEWRKWRKRANLNSGFDFETACEAKKSLETVLEFLYPNHHCIVGAMIMKDDLMTMAEEESSISQGGAR